MAWCWMHFLLVIYLLRGTATGAIYLWKKRNISYWVICLTRHYLSYYSFRDSRRIVARLSSPPYAVSAATSYLTWREAIPLSLHSIWTKAKYSDFLQEGKGWRPSSQFLNASTWLVQGAREVLNIILKRVGSEGQRKR